VNAGTEIKRLKLKPSLVMEMAMSSLRVRLSRTLLTVLTIAVASGFLLYLLTVPLDEGQGERDSWLLMIILSLIVSAAGVLNSMLMAVTQRYREIGTMKCLGALNSFVLLRVLAESAVLGLAGSLLGLIFGALLAALLGMLESGWGFLGALRLEALGLKVLLTLATGMFLTTLGAAIPAIIASRLPPIEAMRGEK
jgi:ABC-type lipoprotein release transport system permease subunit